LVFKVIIDYINIKVKGDKMTATEIASLIASFVSVGIGILAIWLSVVFYRMSSELSESTREAAKGIGSNVEKLEKLFDRLYSDTFSMMKDTVSDMRKHIWPEIKKTETPISEETEEIAGKKLDILKKDISNEIAEVFKKQSITDTKVDSVIEELRNLVEKAIIESRKVDMEAREETIKDHIIRSIKRYIRMGEVARADKLLEPIFRKFDFEDVMNEINKMRDDGIIFFEGPAVGPNTEIRLDKNSANNE
jgi:hypothetical protein